MSGLFTAERLAPPGVSAKKEFRIVAAALCLASIMAYTQFLGSFNAAKGLLYAGNTEIIKQGAIMPDFADLVKGKLMLFAVAAACIPAIAVYDYASFYRDSRSVYTMRRLKQRGEIYWRCIALPAAAELLCAATAFLLLLLFYLHYMRATTPECLAPEQWEKIWRALK